MPENFTPMVKRVIEDPRLLPDGSIERRVRVEYMVGSQGPYTVYFREDQFTAQAVKAAIDARAQVLRGILPAQ